MITETVEQRKKREISEFRFRWLTEQIESLRRQKPNWSDEAIDEVYDRVKDKLLKDPSFGRSRAAVWGAIKKQAGWVASDHKRIRKHPDGSRRNHPRAAESIDRVLTRPDGSNPALSEFIPGPAEGQPENIHERCQEVASIRRAAKKYGVNAERTVIGVMVGVKPVEIAERAGVEVDTVYKWMERFRTLYRAEEDRRVADNREQLPIDTEGSEC